MAFNGNGVFVRLYSWVNDAAAGIKIRADRMDNEMDGMATGLSSCITKDGQTTITANLPMSGFRHTGVGNSANRNEYAATGQVQDGKLNWADAGGTADALTANFSIPVTALVDGQLVFVRAATANATTTPTLSVNGLTARTIVKNGGSALVAGDIVGDGHELILRYDLANTRFELINPRDAVSPSFSDSVFRVTDNGDATKQLAFEVSSITTATTRTKTWQDNNGTVYESGGTDVAVADGGTGASTGIDAFSNLYPFAAQSKSPPQISNNVGDANNDIDIAAGACVLTDGTNYRLVTNAALTKRLDASWSVGTNQGGLDTGAKANSTWYHVWLIYRSDTGVSDALFSTSATAPTMPANYTFKRRIGSVITDGSGNLKGFVQTGNRFQWKTPVLDQNGVTMSTANRTLYALSVPFGVNVNSLINVRITNTGSPPGAYLSDPALDDVATSQSVAPLHSLGWAGSNVSVFSCLTVSTNTSSQIAGRALNANTTLYISTLGWEDLRGTDQ